MMVNIYIYIWLVVKQPLWNILVSWDDDIPNIWNKKTCSKPPTSHVLTKTMVYLELNYGINYGLTIV